MGYKKSGRKFQFKSGKFVDVSFHHGLGRWQAVMMVQTNKKSSVVEYVGYAREGGTWRDAVKDLRHEYLLYTNEKYADAYKRMFPKKDLERIMDRAINKINTDEKTKGKFVPIYAKSIWGQLKGSK